MNLVKQAHDLHDLMELDWQHFEQLVAQVFRRDHWTAAPTQSEADGGADLLLHRGHERALVQCKRWRDDVGVTQVRAFYGVMAAQKVKRGFFVTTSSFTPEADRFARSVGMSLVTGRQLLSKLAVLRHGADPPVQDSKTSEQVATEPSSGRVCPLCLAPMTSRTGRYGPFWGCSRYPECKGWLRIDGNQAPHASA
jgi:restriction system protein